MKKLFLLSVAIIFTANLMAESVNVLLIDGKKIKGLLISHDEKMVVVEPNTLVKYQKSFSPQEVVSFDIEGIGTYESLNGIFVFNESTRVIHEVSIAEIDTSNLHKENQMVQPSNPNTIIGNAMKKCGNAIMGVGVPTLLIGSMLVALGNTGAPSETRTHCATAGYVLMPFGAALTIAGIPLYVEGKRIASFNFNYTGNGAGIAVNF